MSVRAQHAGERLRLRVVPCDLAEANRMVSAMHRHHQPVVGHRFSLAVIDESGLVRGVCIVGRPVARMAGSPRAVAEVARLCTDGAPNACSALYGAAARAAKAMGFVRIQTYTLPSEGGASLRASGWTNEGEAGGGKWEREGSRRNDESRPLGTKWRWVKALNAEQPAITPPEHRDDASAQMSLEEVQR